jgi:hypothetical protein
MATGAVKNKYTFHGLQAGVKYRVRVRAVDGQGNVGPYSNALDIIAGIGSTSRPSNAVTGLVVAGYQQAVRVSWNGVAAAKGYEVYVTEAAGTPPDPDPTNKAQLYYRGNATSILVKSTTGYNVKAKVLWYDEWGRTSSATAMGSAAAT